MFPDLNNMHEASFINVIPPSFEELQSLDEELERSLQTETDISLPIDFDLSLFVKNIAHETTYTNFHVTVNGEIEQLYANNRENLMKIYIIQLRKCNGYCSVPSVRAAQSSNVWNQLHTVNITLMSHLLYMWITPLHCLALIALAIWCKSNGM